MDLLETLHAVVRRALRFRGAKSETRRLLGHSVHYYLARGRGKGPPVVLVHGLGGNANGFARLLFGLAARFSAVYALDLPGNGFSPLPESGPLSLAQHLDVLHAFCRAVVKLPALVVGNSLGGALALMLAVRHREDACGLALLAPAGGQLPPERFAELMGRLEVKTPREGLAFTRRLFHRLPVTALLFATQMVKVHSAPAVRAIRAQARVEDYVTPETLAELRVPTLLLWGESEKLLPEEMLAYYRRHLPPSARVEVVPRVGHVPQMERPREVVRRLAEFAQEAGLPGFKGGARPISGRSRESGSAPAPSRA
jgi:pimeloyl-ACP methyl ester carboxylesterase